MNDKKHIKYAQKLKASGRTDEQIMAALVNLGDLSEDQVNEVMAQLAKSPIEDAEPADATEPASAGAGAKPKKKKFLFF